jgi:hypothetical protein
MTEREKVRANFEAGAKAQAIIQKHGYEVEFSSFGGIHFYTMAPWQPDVYTQVENNRPAGFQIQTSSYGALPVADVRCMINGLEEAVRMVTELNELYGIKTAF